MEKIGTKLLKVATVGGLLAFMNSAFTYAARREIGERDSWACQCGCGRSYQQGWMVQAAHYSEKHQKAWDNNPRNGRIMATECHLLEEIQRGNIWGAKELWKSQTIRHYEWINSHGGQDEKEPFEYYLQKAGVEVVEA